jgi:hypothetical protein
LLDIGTIWPKIGVFLAGHCASRSIEHPTHKFYLLRTNIYVPNIVLLTLGFRCSIRAAGLGAWDKGLIPSWSRRTIEAGHPQRMPNPDRALAKGEPLYTLFIDIFGDDVSGNRSKSWNKHWNIYFTHRNLPRAILQKESHIHFTSTSPNATIPEQFQAIKDAIE